jgi:CRP/FNR family transcriptional regulator, cyclic AMP receptor protein
LFDAKLKDCYLGTALAWEATMSGFVQTAERKATDVPGPDATLTRLSRVPLFAGVPMEALRELGAKARWFTLATDEMVVDTGDEGQEVFFVLEGVVRVVLRSACGDELILGELGPGEFFGELAAIDGVQRSASVTAVVRASLCQIPGESFMKIVLGTQPVGRRLLQLLAAKLRAKDERFLEATSLPTHKRVLAELLRLSRNALNGDRVVSPPLPQQILAARLGLRRETISREIAKLVRAGQISVRRTAIVIHEAERARAELQRQLRGNA